MNPQSAFCRRLEAAYESKVSMALAAGASAEQAHMVAIEQVRELGSHALNKLRRAGLLPSPAPTDLSIDSLRRAGARQVHLG